MIICDTCHQTLDYMKDDDELILHSLNELINIASDASVHNADKYAQVVELLLNAKSIMEVNKVKKECSPELIALMEEIAPEAKKIRLKIQENSLTDEQKKNRWWNE